MCLEIDPFVHRYPRIQGALKCTILIRCFWGNRNVPAM